MNRPGQVRKKDPSEVILPDLSKLKPVQAIHPSVLSRIIRRGGICPAVTDTEITEAAKTKLEAGRLLAASAFHKLRVVQSGDRARDWGDHDLPAFLRVQRANEVVDNTRHSKASKQERKVAARIWDEEHMKYGRQARGFAALLGAVARIDEHFIDTYTNIATGRPNRDAITELYKETDGKHSLLAALPEIDSLTDRDRQDAVVRANHILRAAIWQEQLAIPEQRTSGYNAFHGI